LSAIALQNSGRHKEGRRRRFQGGATIEYGRFIGGKRVAGASGRKGEVFQPMDGTARGAVAFASPAEIRAASPSKVQVGMVGVNAPIPVPVAYYTFGGCKRSAFGDLN
jgi:acyl-CoA reductase-like NAD-dependent aldehyde dehydrogenase